MGPSRLGVRRWLTRQLIEYLTQPLPRYEVRARNDPVALKRHIRKGDVLLVEGDQRISAVIKFLTQSSWSHSAVYIGDELLVRGGELREHALERFGDEAGFLVVEALADGVVASPLIKYIDYNIRLCRPHRLRPEHRKTIMDEAVASIGFEYDLRNVLDLARYMLPVSWIPGGMRQTALHFGSGKPTEVICSSLLGRLFQQVRFPVRPQVSYTPEEKRRRRRGLGRLLLGFQSSDYTGIFRMRHPTLLTPRDFDLSPYFEIVKFNVVAEGRFDYQRIQWAEDPEPEEAEAGPREH